MKPFKQPVNCSHGAPMGRPSDNPANLDGVSVTLSSVQLTDGYDDGGAYWGCGEPLFCAIGENDDEAIIHYFRAGNRQHAIEKLTKLGATVIPESPDDYLETMVDHYLIAALWSSTDDDGEQFENMFFPDAIDESSRNQATEDCKSFIELAGTLLANWSPEQVGLDFWLSRNGHGAGFFDRTHIADKETCKALQKIARTFKELNVYTNDNVTVGIE